MVPVIKIAAQQEGLLENEAETLEDLSTEADALAALISHTWESVNFNEQQANENKNTALNKPHQGQDNGTRNNTSQHSPISQGAISCGGGIQLCAAGPVAVHGPSINEQGGGMNGSGGPKKTGRSRKHNYRKYIDPNFATQWMKRAWAESLEATSSEPVQRAVMPPEHMLVDPMAWVTEGN